MIYADSISLVPAEVGADCREYIHRIDAADLIVAVNADWLVFAKENAVSPAAFDVVGTSLWTYISGVEVEYLYRLLLRTVRRTQRRIHFPFRCDTPTLQRSMQMVVVRHTGDEVEFRSHVLHQRPTTRVPLLEPASVVSSTLLRMCSWCRRVQLVPDQGSEEWVEPQVAIARLDLFAHERSPQITHSVCPTCEQRMLSIC